MATIMGCTAASLPDDLMDDYARCVETFGMDKISAGLFLGTVWARKCWPSLPSRDSRWL